LLEPVTSATWPASRPVIAAWSASGDCPRPVSPGKQPVARPAIEIEVDAGHIQPLAGHHRGRGTHLIESCNRAVGKILLKPSETLGELWGGAGPGNGDHGDRGGANPPDRPRRGREPETGGDALNLRSDREPMARYRRGIEARPGDLPTGVPP